MIDFIFWGQPVWIVLPVALFAYLLGSIPFGLVITKLAGLDDIRTIGSGNIGATNVLRTGHRSLAFLTLIGDSGKGALAVLICWSISLDMAALAAFFATLGHLFPVWLKFKGGKGVATTLGVHLALHPIVGLIACLGWLLTASLTRISSLSALIAFILTPISAYILMPGNGFKVSLALAALIWWAHRGNIIRLIQGKEPRIGKKKDETLMAADE